jgi:chaperonin GroES
MFQPLLDRVAIRKESGPRKTEGGIFVGSTDEEKQTDYGVVVAVGPGAYNSDGSQRPIGVKPGDKVLFFDYHDTFTHSDIVIVEEDNILTVVTENPKPN